MRLRFNEDATVSNPSGYCISRNMSDCLFANTAQPNVNECLAAPNYEALSRCLEAKPHIAGHWGVGALVSSLFTYLCQVFRPTYLSHPHS
jgi:hypothetical protein